MYNEKEYDKNYYQLNKEKIKVRTKINCGGKGVQGDRVKAKKLCRQLANYTCQICGNEGLDAHHLIPVEKGGSDDQSNLICVCRSCHQKIHHGTLKLIDGEWVYLVVPSKYVRNDEFVERRDYRKELNESLKYFHSIHYMKIVHLIWNLKRNFNSLTLEQIEEQIMKIRQLKEIMERKENEKN